VGAVIPSPYKGNTMIHGVYVKSRPKGVWHLVSVAISAEAASYEQKEVLNQAIKDGNEKAEAAVQLFESAFFIPEYLYEIKEQKLMYN
jgi:hypothetical protein